MAFVHKDKGCVQTKLGLLPIRGHTNAQTIFETLTSVFDEYKLPTDLLVAHTSDCPSIMLATRRGVVNKVKKHIILCNIV